MFFKNFIINIIINNNPIFSRNKKRPLSYERGLLKLNE